MNQEGSSLLVGGLLARRQSLQHVHLQLHDADSTSISQSSMQTLQHLKMELPLLQDLNLEISDCAKSFQEQPQINDMALAQFCRAFQNCHCQ
jgi:hypothetical protein